MTERDIDSQLGLPPDIDLQNRLDDSALMSDDNQASS